MEGCVIAGTASLDASLEIPKSMILIAVVPSRLRVRIRLAGLRSR